MFVGSPMLRLGTLSKLDRTVHVATACMRGRLGVWHSTERRNGQTGKWKHTSLRSALMVVAQLLVRPMELCACSGGSRAQPAASGTMWSPCALV